MRIRKISVGPDYKTAMNYCIDQKVVGGNRVSEIRVTDSGMIEVWIKNVAEEVFKWKEFTSTMPISIEFNIDQFSEA